MAKGHIIGYIRNNKLQLCLIIHRSPLKMRVSLYGLKCNCMGGVYQNESSRHIENSQLFIKMFLSIV